jgi:hypothetical protein
LSLPKRTLQFGAAHRDILWRRDLQSHLVPVDPSTVTEISGPTLIVSQANVTYIGGR